MKQFYKITNGELETGSGQGIPEGYLEYDETSEELSSALSSTKEREAAMLKLEYCKKCLNETDWYMVRKIETGEEVPEDVTSKRTEAREFIRSQEDA